MYVKMYVKIQHYPGTLDIIVDSMIMYRVYTVRPPIKTQYSRDTTIKGTLSRFSHRPLGPSVQIRES